VVVAAVVVEVVAAAVEVVAVEEGVPADDLNTIFTRNNSQAQNN
jgi:hypothetical protein